MTNDEIVAENVRAVAMLYAAHELEVMGLIDVVDRIVELFMDGQLPVSNDSGGSALDEYQSRAGNRMSAAERWMLYRRVLGASGGPVSEDVAPNTEFDDLFTSFLSALAAAHLAEEHIRAAGRRLAGNATSQGGGGAHMGARHIRDHIAGAMSVLEDPDIQHVWDARSVWQVVERVSTDEFGTTPHIVRHRTMAESGKAILDLLAKNSDAWSDGGDICPDDETELERHAAKWLAVKANATPPSG